MLGRNTVLQVAADLVRLAGVGVACGRSLTGVGDGSAQQLEVGDLGVEGGEALGEDLLDVVAGGVAAAALASLTSFSGRCD